MDEKIKALWAAAVAKLKEVWNKNKILFFIIIPLILLAKFRDLIIDFLVASGKRLMDNARKQDQQLRNEANSANNQANQLIANADKKDDNKPLVDEDWHKK
jgi:hypothetical protein